MPLIIVGRLSLGAINHMLLTVREAQRAGVAVAGMILNQTAQEQGLAEQTNPEVICRFTDAPLLGIMPFVPSGRPPGTERRLQDLAERHLLLSLLCLKRAASEAGIPTRKRLHRLWPDSLPCRPVPLLIPDNAGADQAYGAGRAFFVCKIHVSGIAQAHRIKRYPHALKGNRAFRQISA